MTSKDIILNDLFQNSLINLSHESIKPFHCSVDLELNTINHEETLIET